MWAATLRPFSVTEATAAGTCPVMQCEVLQIANDASDVGAEREAVASKKPDDGHDTHGNEALHHDRQDVLAPDQSAVEECQARRHQTHQCSTDQHKRGITAVNRAHNSPPRKRTILLRQEHNIANLWCGLAEASRSSTRMAPPSLRARIASSKNRSASWWVIRVSSGALHVHRPPDVLGADRHVRQLRAGRLPDRVAERGGDRDHRVLAYPAGAVRSVELGRSRR